ncbi:glycosyltransferase family 2 protein [Roseobacter sp. S98]|uniref:glycosyltransferase family 2 protein n=1 Tax=Roseobacter algicola (ex Choi et al. 2025) (nom. illeg.) TaxID=3092138 RepID=UPI0035C667CF
MTEISVLLPVHNGALFLDETLYSLRQQAFDDFEVLCIDDCSTDASPDVIRRHADEDSRIIYLRTGVNLGSAASACNFAASHATGQWFVYSSQDDLFSRDWLSNLHDRVMETRADAVLPDVVFYHASGKQDREIIGFHGDRSAVLTGREAFVASLDWTVAGNALWPIRFLRSSGFDEFNVYADEYSVRRFFLECERVVFCQGTFYYRQDNDAAVTKKSGPALLDAADASLRLWALVCENGFDRAIHGPFALRTLRVCIRAMALVINTPHLEKEADRLEDVWHGMHRSPDFHASLAAADMNGLRRAHYTRAVQSRTWFLLAAKMSALFARLKRR